MELPYIKGIQKRIEEHSFYSNSHEIDEVHEVLDGVPHPGHVAPHLTLHAVLPIMLQAPQTLLKHCTQ